jgi:hypothetical protein
VPKFHGLYAFAVPGQDRNAWLLLRQYIPGTPLDQMDPDELSARERGIIMDEVVEAAYQVLQAGGVWLNYLAPRNSILCEQQPESTPSISHEPYPDSSIFFVDFHDTTRLDTSSEYFENKSRRIEENRYRLKLEMFEEAGWVAIDRKPEGELPTYKKR